MKTLLAIPILALMINISFEGWSQTPGDIREFVKKNYTHGLPFEQAEAYGRKAIPELIVLLDDSQYKDYKHNIVLVLGIVGDSTAIAPLKKCLNDLKGELDPEGFFTMLHLFQAFGYIAGTGNKESLELLFSYASATNQATTDPQISYKSYKGPTMTRLLQRLAVQGLAISGDANALNRLEEMNTPGNARFRSDLSSDLKNAIELNKRVKNEGKRNVFGKEVNHENK